LKFREAASAPTSRRVFFTRTGYHFAEKRYYA
jgi:hypothetical protein